MKKLPQYRLMVQLTCLALTILGFFANFQVTVLILTVATFIAGAFYCGWVCVFGTFQDLFSRWGKYMRIKKRKMPKAIQAYLKYVRYIVFALVTISASDLIFSLLSYDPRSNFTMLLTGNGATLGIVLVMASFGFMAIFFERPFCNYLCYEGAKYGLFSSLRFVTVKRNEDSCVGCNKCDNACPMNIEVSKGTQVNSLQCINCLECTAACHVEATHT